MNDHVDAFCKRISYVGIFCRKTRFQHHSRVLGKTFLYPWNSKLENLYRHTSVKHKDLGNFKAKNKLLRISDSFFGLNVKTAINKPIATTIKINLIRLIIKNTNFGFSILVEEL